MTIPCAITSSPRMMPMLWVATCRCARCCFGGESYAEGTRTTDAQRIIKEKADRCASEQMHQPSTLHQTIATSHRQDMFNNFMACSGSISFCIGNQPTYHLKAIRLDLSLRYGLL